MTMKPKARRFRLRLGEDATGAAVPSVAPQHPGQTQARASGGPARDPAEHAMGDSGGALFDEDSGDTGLSAPSPVRTTSPASATPANGRDTAARTAAAMAMAKLRQTASSAPSRPADAAKPTDSPAIRSPGQSRNAALHGADLTGSPEIEDEIAAIRAEELTGRQLRMALRVAQKHGIKATSGLEAVRLLRRQGIDPFEHSTLLDIVKNKDEPGRALTTTSTPPLPKTYRQPSPPAAPAPVSPASRAEEIARIQRDISRRRRRRLALLGARLMVLVMLPTLLAAWYFYVIATPLYATNTEFVIQQADAQQSAAGAGGLGGLFSGTGLATSQDSVTVQSYLQSREAMRRLDADHGFKAHFQDARVDPMRRLALDATDEAAYRLYRRHVQISYDPTEGIIKMEVIAADPETSERFSRALIQYAEDQVDQLTQRLRENQMRDAMESFERSEARMMETQMRVLELQESYQVLSSEVEVTLLTQQITTLDAQLNQERLSLQDLMANPRPNVARVQQVERRIGALETQIQALRSSLTQGGTGGGVSLARIQRELVMAEADVATRQMMLANSMQQLEAARIEANRQVRYLSMGVSPIAPDEATYPRRLENTALAFLIFAGAYLMISMTVSILREQVTS